MENKSIIITTGEFRKDIRKYLDLVVNGKVVIIDRFGQRFMVSYLPKEVDFIIGIQEEAEKNIAFPPEAEITKS